MGGGRADHRREGGAVSGRSAILRIGHIGFKPGWKPTHQLARSHWDCATLSVGYARRGRQCTTVPTAGLMHCTEQSLATGG